MAPTRTVLVVEQDPLNRKLFRDILEASGYLATGCDDARKAAALIKRRKSDCLVMNIRFPGDEDLSLIEAIKSDPAIRAVPIIAVSAMALSGDKERIMAAGCAAYLAKPLAIKDFIAVVERVLSQAARSA